MTCTCPATSRMICLFDDQSDAMSDRADLRYTICFATDAISSSAMNVSLRLATKSKACEKVAKVRYRQIIYRTNADIVSLPPFGPGVFLPMSIYWLALERWHAICSTCNIYSSTNRVSSDDWYLSWQPFGWYVCSTTSRMIRPRR